MTSGSSIQAMPRSVPPHLGQVSMSIENTRFKRCIQIMGATGLSGSGSLGSRFASTPSRRKSVSDAGQDPAQEPGSLTRAVPNTRVSPASLLTVMSISTSPASSSMSVTTPLMWQGSVDKEWRPEYRVESMQLGLRSPAVDHRRQKALAHDPRYQSPGKPLPARRFMVVEAGSAPVRRRSEPLHVVHARIGIESG